MWKWVRCPCRNFSHIWNTQRALLQRPEGLFGLVFGLPLGHMFSCPLTEEGFCPKLNELHSRKGFPAVQSFLSLCFLSLLAVLTEKPWITRSSSLSSLIFQNLSSPQGHQPSVCSLPQLGNIFHCSRQTLEKYNNTSSLHQFLVIWDVSGGQAEARG